MLDARHGRAVSVLYGVTMRVVWVTHPLIGEGAWECRLREGSAPSAGRFLLLVLARARLNPCTAFVLSLSWLFRALLSHSPAANWRQTVALLCHIAV